MKIIICDWCPEHEHVPATQSVVITVTPINAGAVQRKFEKDGSTIDLCSRHYDGLCGFIDNQKPT